VLAPQQNKLEALLIEQMMSNINRRSVTSTSKWAEQYRVMGKPFPGKWKFTHHPWLKQMHDDLAEMLIGQKAAQMGYTEVALNKTFKAIDLEGESVLYVLPANTPDANDFSTARFDPALEMSDHLTNMFTDVKNIGHKRAGNANLYIRGSRSRSQLKSIPVAFVVVDEKDEMVQENVAMIFERMSGQIEKQAFQISTPTIDKYGINSDFIISSQNTYMFRCPRCRKYTSLEFPECIVITAEEVTDPRLQDSYLQCKECKGKLIHEAKTEWLGFDNAKWIESFTDRYISGYHINQLYSMTVKPWEIGNLWLKAQTNPSDEQEFYNSKLGLTHIVEGARVTDNAIASCTGDFKKAVTPPPNALLTMGVDVGKWLHYEIDQWFFDQDDMSLDINLMASAKLIYEGKVLHFEELDKLMKRFGIMYCVIDAHPEKRKAIEFAQRHWGHVKLCYYGNNIGASKQIHVHAEEEHTMTVDRTSWLDMSFSRFHGNRIRLPVDLSHEYKEHIKAPVRVYEKDGYGNPIGRYVVGNEDDHFAHARNYSELALPLAASISMSYDIGKVL
jgi:hypothetical protein